MISKHRQNLLLVFFVLFMVLLQLSVSRLERNLSRQFDLLEFGSQTFIIAFFSIVLGATSGFILAFFFLTPKRNSESRKSQTLFKAILLSIFPALAILIKMSFAAFGPNTWPFIFTLFGSFRFLIFEWITNSQVPSFWLGAVTGWTVKQLLR